MLITCVLSRSICEMKNFDSGHSRPPRGSDAAVGVQGAIVTQAPVSAATQSCLVIPATVIDNCPRLTGSAWQEFISHAREAQAGSPSADSSLPSADSGIQAVFACAPAVFNTHAKGASLGEGFGGWLVGRL